MTFSVLQGLTAGMCCEIIIIIIAVVAAAQVKLLNISYSIISFKPDTFTKVSCSVQRSPTKQSVRGRIDYCFRLLLVCSAKE
ncbi:hypothetical protein M433DRAFT_150930 [Acidomyces richmondensis BFW]|nr:MAG: hypothetical protein FE78DRAFT_84267 [Acidomyces sp. 'richmondensis']KYG48582.1 hypothetical protein M433DRAFT_150930 [Acidomyces richmondensis BFW]